MSRVAIFTPHVTTGAAVSSDALGMQKVLEAHGHDARLYAESWDLERARIWSVNEINGFLTTTDDILIYHHSIGWGPGLELLLNLQCRKVIKYHNITPGQFFANISPWHEEKCHDGRQQVRAIAAAHCDLYLADSDYNRQELLTAGVDPSQSFVVPPFHQIDELHDIEADLKTLDAYRDGQTVIVCVGRIAPHKGQLDLIEAFAAYHHDYNRESRLLLVGREQAAFESYSMQLRGRLKFFYLDDAVVFIGEVPDAALKACYLLGNAFVFAGEHEGFCLPLVEAMAMKVPIVAYEAAAIPETVGDAGILLDERDPYLMAESINSVVSEEAVNVALGMLGRNRYEQNFTHRHIENKFLQALGNLD